ncbi:LPS-assembly protein LptD [Psittacicella hinzii]|nr:LPS assembly protein LptD [Psittacicella hinzii]
MTAVILSQSMALNLAYADTVTTDFTKNLPSTDVDYSNPDSTSVFLFRNVENSLTLSELDRRYPALNYTYYNTFTSQVYEAIKEEQIKKRFLSKVPTSDGKTYDYNQIPIVIQADYMFSKDRGDQITYTGNVSMIQGDRHIKAQEIVYTRGEDGKQYITVKGDVNLASNQLVLDADQIVVELLNSNTQEVSADKTTFALVDTIMHGQAESLDSSDNITKLNRSELYAGPIRPFTLNIGASETIIDMNNQELTFKRATIRIGKVPLMWFPSFSVNISGKPQTGFKEPTIGLNSNTGFNINIPFVWYINQNMKYTISAFFSSKLGLLLNNNLDFATKYGITTINYAFSAPFMNRKDDTYRYYLGVRHLATFGDYDLSLNYRGVSDKRYFYDYYNNTDSYLTSNYSLSYAKDNWSWDLSAYTFKPIYNTESKAYNSAPEFNFNYRQPFAYNKFRFALTGQAAHLYNGDADIYTKADRFYLKSSILYSATNSVFKSDYSLSQYLNFYHQYNRNTNRYENIVRSAPEFKAEFSTKLVRDTLAFDRYAVTVTPSFGYTFRRISNKYDERFHNYDSSTQLPSILMVQNGIYNYGIDSLQDANDINLGYKVSYIDRFSGQDKLSARVNLIQSITKLKYLDIQTKQRYSKYKRNLVLGVHYNIADKFNFDTANIIDLTKGNSSMGVVSFNYQPNLTNIVQLNYRYATKKYLEDALITSYRDKEIKQLGIAYVWDINPQLSMLFSNYIDLKDRKLVDRNIAFNYVYYGWSISISYERRRVGANQYENGFDFSLNLIGFNNSYNSRFGRYINSGKIPFVGNR